MTQHLALIANALCWKNMSIPDNLHPITRKGRLSSWGHFQSPWSRPESYVVISTKLAQYTCDMLQLHGHGKSLKFLAQSFVRTLHCAVLNCVGFTCCTTICDCKWCSSVTFILQNCCVHPAVYICIRACVLKLRIRASQHCQPAHALPAQKRCLLHQQMVNDRNLNPLCYPWLHLFWSRAAFGT